MPNSFGVFPDFNLIGNATELGVQNTRLLLPWSYYEPTQDFFNTTRFDNDINIHITVAPINAVSVNRSDQGYILLLRDITHEKSMEEQRDEFISLVSHELRTPVAIIEGGVSIALEDKKNPLSTQL